MVEGQATIAMDFALPEARRLPLRGSSASAPIFNAIGNIPAPIATVVMMIGCARFLHASISASRREPPFCNAASAYSTTRSSSW